MFFNDTCRCRSYSSEYIVNDIFSRCEKKRFMVQDKITERKIQKNRFEQEINRLDSNRPTVRESRAQLLSLLSPMLDRFKNGQKNKEGAHICWFLLLFVFDSMNELVRNLSVWTVLFYFDIFKRPVCISYTCFYLNHSAPTQINTTIQSHTRHLKYHMRSNTKHFPFIFLTHLTSPHLTTSNQIMPNHFYFQR